MNKMQIVWMDPRELKPYERNARKHEKKDLDAIRASIREFGFNDPIGIWSDENLIVEGHGRQLAAIEEGLESVPCIRLDHLTDEERRAYALAHNKTAELSEWNIQALDIELAGIKEIDMAALGFSPADVELTPDDVDEDDVPEDAEPRCERGMVWALGDHRLMCGDSTSSEDLEKLLDGEKPVMVFTDPPYGVAIGDKNKKLSDFGCKGGIQKNIIGDTLGKDELHEVLVKAFSNLKAHAAEYCSYYVSTPQGGDLGLMMLTMMKDSGLPVRHNLVWVKNAATFSLGRLDYDYRHEPIFYTWGTSHKFYGGYSNTVIDDTQDLEKMTKSELKETLRAIYERSDTSVIYEDKPVKSKLHPTMKPVKLVARFIYNSSRRGEAIADIFGGSGTTLIAAEQLNRRCYMMELDPHYCDVIIERWERLTGKTAELIKR